MEKTTQDVAEVTQSHDEEQIIAIPAAGRDLTLVSAAHAVIHAVAVLMPLIYPFIQKEYNLSYTQIGLIVALPNLVGGFLQIVFGLLSRYILRKVMLGVGSILVGVCTFFTGTITGYWSLMLWSLLSRIAGAPQHPVGSSYLSDRYGRKRHGYALAWHVAGGNIGTLAVPLIAGPLLGMWGWRPVLYLAALPGILIGIAILILVYERGPLERRVLQKETSRQKGSRQLATGLKALVQPLQNRTLAIIMVVSIVAAGGRGLGNVTTYVPLYLQNVLHFNSSVISIMFTILLLGSVLLPLLDGRLSDMAGWRLILLICYLNSLLTKYFILAVAMP